MGSIRWHEVNTHLLPADSTYLAVWEGRFIMNRSLKIHEVGYFHRKKTIPTIILSGKWLANSGFPPNARVTVQTTKSGELIITLEEKLECEECQ